MKISKKLFSKAFDWANKIGVTDYDKRWTIIAAYRAGWNAHARDLKRTSELAEEERFERFKKGI